MSEHAWNWLLRALGVMVFVVATVNLVDIGTHVYRGLAVNPDHVAAGVAASPTDSRVDAGLYHPECPKLGTPAVVRVRRAAQRLVRMDDVGPQAQLCHRCGGVIEGDAVWIAGR